MTRATLRRSLWQVAAAFALAGVALSLAPAPRGGRITPAIPEVGRTPIPAAIDSSAAEEIALANVFSPTRTPPPTRYAPVAEGIDSSGIDAGSLPADAPPGMGDVAAVPALFGTIIDDTGAQTPRAILLLDAATTTPRSYGVGEGDGGYRVLSIAPRTVVLRGPGGRVTLRLPPEEDSP